MSGRKPVPKSNGLYRDMLEWLILTAPYLIGLYYPWNTVFATLWLLWLLVRIAREEGVCFSRSSCMLFSGSLVLFLMGGMLWGADHGMALIGAVQFFPLPLFVLALEQFEPGDRMHLLRRVPYSASLMVLLSWVLGQIPALRSWFLIDGRLSGFFQYPNSFALYLLSATVLLLFGEPMGRGRKSILLVILLGGIALSGSRTVFLLLILVLLICCFRGRGREDRLIGFAALVLLIGGAGLYVLITGRFTGAGRIWTSSFSSSALLGRILYGKDAMPVIIRHPFGLGYMGYSWLQGSFQTGVYTVTHVHNELLQLLLDVGWVPAGLLIWALIRSFLKKDDNWCRKLLLTIICLHSIFDFDIQFLAIGFMLFTAMDVELPDNKSKKGNSWILFPAAMVGAVSVWIATASLMLWIGNPAAAARLYPSYTTALVQLLPRAETNEAEAIADRILRLNNSVSLAHDVKARAAFQEGRFSIVIQEKKEAIRLAKYNLEEYLDYLDLLETACRIYQSKGDENSAEICRNEAAVIPGMLRQVREHTSALGWKINDQPELDLPHEYVVKIQKMTGHPVI